MLPTGFFIIPKKLNMKKFIVILNVFFILFLYSCSHKEGYMEKFGKFINEVEIAQEQYDEDEWEIAEADFNYLSKIKFSRFKNELTEAELKQIRSYRERFKMIQIKRDPSGSLLEIMGF